MIKLRPSDG